MGSVFHSLALPSAKFFFRFCFRRHSSPSVPRFLHLPLNKKKVRTSWPHLTPSPVLLLSSLSLSDSFLWTFADRRPLIVVCVWPTQFWLYSKSGEIRRDEACLDYAGTEVILYPCHGAKGNQYWEYDSEVRPYSHHAMRCHPRRRRVVIVVVVVVVVVVVDRATTSSTAAARTVWPSARTRRRSPSSAARRTTRASSGSSPTTTPRKSSSQRRLAN